MDRTDALDIVHDFREAEMSGRLQAKVDMVGVDFEAEQIKQLDFHGVGNDINQGIAKNVLLKIRVSMLGTGG